MMMTATYLGKKVFVGICRHCEHFHRDDVVCNGTFTERNYNASGCPCNTWAPEDNLEYLEYLAMEKNNDR